MERLQVVDVTMIHGRRGDNRVLEAYHSSSGSSVLFRRGYISGTYRVCCDRKYHCEGRHIEVLNYAVADWLVDGNSFKSYLIAAVVAIVWDCMRSQDAPVFKLQRHKQVQVVSGQLVVANSLQRCNRTQRAEGVSNSSDASFVCQLLCLDFNPLLGISPYTHDNVQELASTEVPLYMGTQQREFEMWATDPRPIKNGTLYLKQVSFMTLCFEVLFLTGLESSERTSLGRDFLSRGTKDWNCLIKWSPMRALAENERPVVYLQQGIHSELDISSGQKRSSIDDRLIGRGIQESCNCPVTRGIRQRDMDSEESVGCIAYWNREYVVAS